MQEMIVQRAAIQPMKDYQVMAISVVDEEQLVRQIHIRNLRPDGRTMAAYPSLQKIGSH
jgi:hypothetical protein